MKQHDKRNLPLAGLVASLLLLYLPHLALGVTASSTLVVYNTLDPESVAITQYYSQAHPEVRTMGLPLGDVGEQVNAQYYLDNIRAPMMSVLKTESWGESIDLIVTTKGMPLRIDAGPAPLPNPSYNWRRYSSLESELTRIDRIDTIAEMGDQFWLPASYGSTNVLPANPYYRKSGEFSRSNPVNEQMRLSARLDGYTVSDVLASIDRASGAYYIPANSYVVVDDDPTAGMDLMTPLVNDVLAPSSQSYLYDNSAVALTTAPARVLGYVSHGVHAQELRTGYISNQLDFLLSEGAAFLTHESFNAFSFDPSQPQGQGSIAEWLAIGGTVGVGNVQEPISGPNNLVNEDQFFRMLLSGHTYAEAAWSSLRQLSFVNTVVGDPLMRLTPVQPGDANFNGTVDTGDLTLVLTNFTGDVKAAGGKTLGNGDFDGDGDVDTADLTLGFQNFTGAGTQASLVSVPEPSAWVLLVLGGLWLVVFRRQGMARA